MKLFFCGKTSDGHIGFLRLTNGQVPSFERSKLLNHRRG